MGRKRPASPGAKPAGRRPQSPPGKASGKAPSKTPGAAFLATPALLAAFAWLPLQAQAQSATGTTGAAAVTEAQPSETQPLDPRAPAGALPVDPGFDAALDAALAQEAAQGGAGAAPAAAGPLWGTPVLAPGPIVPAQPALRRPAEDQGPAGATLRFGLSQGLTWASNPDLLNSPARDTVFSRTGLSFGYESQSRVSRFSFGLDAGLEAGDIPGETRNTRLGDYGARLGYQTSSINSRFGLNATTRRARQGADTIPDDFTGGDLTVSGGERGTTQLGLDMATGLNGPLQFSLSANHNAIRYYDTVDDQAGRDTMRANARMTLALSQRSDLTLSTGLDQRDDRDETAFQSKTTHIGLSLGHDLTQALRGQIELRQTRISERETDPVSGLRSEDSSTGAGAIVSLNWARANGTLGLAYDNQLYTTGRRQTLSLSRDMELALGQISGSFGLTESDNGTNPMLDLSWSGEGRADRYGISYSQSVSGDRDNEVLRSRLAIDWSHDLTPASRLGLTLGIADSSPTGNSGTDRRRTDISLGYMQDLTRDWSLDLRLSHQIVDEKGRPTRTDDTLFLGLAREFETRLD